MKKLMILGAVLSLTACTTREVEKTVVQREPTRVVVEHRDPATVTRERITEQRTDAYGAPIEERRKVTTEYVR